MNIVHATLSLRDEHRLILRVLDSLEIALGQWREAGAAAPGQCAAFAEFLREFADGCHHRKEEELLFATLARANAATAGSPVMQLAMEHERLRALARDIAIHAAPAEAGDRTALSRLLDSGAELAAVLRRHIDKEEHCLFGMAEQIIRGNGYAELVAALRVLEAEPNYRRRYARGRALAERLATDHGLPPARLVSAAAPTSRADAFISHHADDPARAAAPTERAPWQACRIPLLPEPGTELAAHCAHALASEAVGLLHRALERVGRRIAHDPMLWKALPGGYLRLFFSVTGQVDRIESGTVVAIVLLYDVASERTLYAHPVYASPEANPLLKHVGGPMAQPRAQVGENGVSATRRLLYHKMAIWDAHVRERRRLGPDAASQRWRARYGWSLVRLYFCERCAACRWGSPFFAGDDGMPLRVETGPADGSDSRPGDETDPAVTAIRASPAWRIETAYARRGGFRLTEVPRLVTALGDDWTIAVFPTDAEILDGGSIVAAAAYHHRPTGGTHWVQCLVAGAEAETLFVSGDALGLPFPGGSYGPQPGLRYAAWRRRAWSRFWLDELELGVHAASTRWLTGYWQALRLLFRIAA
ncbi:MAG TPA: hemerythrin domain-containing protein [Gammaproteobacteria bacterium]|nr:hemerythrin domain-containing protein [Gammaproteobacteria bacterium]